MKRRTLFFIALALTLPLALIIPLRIARSWQPRVTALPTLGTTSSPYSGSGALLWRANGLWLALPSINTRKTPESLVNWNGERVAFHAFAAETLDLSRDGNTVALLKTKPAGGNALDLMSTIETRRQGATRWFPAIGANQTFSFQVPQLSLSPDGTRVAWMTSSPDGATIADAHTGRTIAQFQLPPRASTSLVTRSQVGAVIFSPAGKQLALATDYGLLFVDAATGKIQRRRNLNASAPTATRAAWSPDGTMLALYTGHPLQFAAPPPALKAQSVVYLRVVNARTGQELHSWSQMGTAAQPQGVTNVAWSPDGQQIAWGTYNGDALILTFNSRKIERRFPVRANNWAQFVAYAPDGNTLAVASPDKITLWRVR